MTALDQAESAFHSHFGCAPDGVAFAAGRVNLIGEHVDYNDGLVLPMPIAHGTAVAWKRSPEAEVEIYAADMRELDRFPIADPPRPPGAGWRSYCRGMVANAPALPDQGIRMAIAGDMPRGGGLSSSASLCIAVGRALAAASGIEPDAIPLAIAAQRTEHDFAGVSCGIMDQMAIAAARPGMAMMLDCRDLSSEHIATPQGWAVLVVDSGISRGLMDGAYNARRAECAEAASLLGVSTLRDATLEQLEDADLPDILAMRARHVIEEIARVRRAASAIRESDIVEFGHLLSKGHASLRNLFEVSVPAVDRLVADLQRQLGDRGGARMTGAGFGGSVVVVAEQEAAMRIAPSIQESLTSLYIGGAA
jgi:galactokinase